MGAFDYDTNEFIPFCDMDGVNGFTHFMNYIPPYSIESAKFKPFTDIHLTPCLNTSSSNPYWQFNIANIRIPIVQDVCIQKALDFGYVNLGDGKDETLLNNGIKDCLDLYKAYKAIKWWADGTYQNEIDGNEQKFKFFSDTGILAHENIHINQIAETLNWYMNDKDLGMKVYREDQFLLDKGDYPCPEDALNGAEEDIKETLRDQIFNGQDLSAIYDAEFVTIDGEEVRIGHEELIADLDASHHYIELLERMVLWARNQPWWNDYDYDCVFVYSKIYF